MRKLLSLRAHDSRSVLLVAEGRHGLVARRTVLEDLGCEVTTAPGAAEGAALFAAKHYDLVVTDHKLPRMNGIAMIGEIRKISRSAPVILLAAFPEQLGLDESSTGANCVIAKGANEVAELGRALARLLGRKVSKKPPRPQGGTAKRQAKSS
jgi:CheY-like chemotaxis protein